MSVKLAMMWTKMRISKVQQVVLITLGLNLLVAGAKGAYGYFSGSLAITTDALHSLLDGASNIVGLVALKMAASPPDPDHPYGHHKMEMIAACAVGLLIAGSSLTFLWSAIGELRSGSPPPHITVEGFVIMGVTLCTNIFIATYEARQGRKLNSPFLAADAAHTASDVLVTLAVIGSMIATRFGVTWADPIATFGVVLIIFIVAWRILAENLGILVDRAIINADEVRKEALAIDGVVGCHRVRSRGVASAVLVDLHIQVDGDIPLRRAHDISHVVEAHLRTTFSGITDVVIHVEPEEDDEEDL